MDLGARLVGDDVTARCVDGEERRYCNLDAAASTPALDTVADAVTDFLPYYSSIHRGAGFKSQVATAAYEEARRAVLAFAGRDGRDDVAIICRNTTEAINHLAYRMRLAHDDVVLTTVAEHHANLLPWGRVARRRFVECGRDGRFRLDDIVAGLDAAPRPQLLAVTGASNVSGWLPPISEIIDAAHGRGVPVLVDAAQLAPHRALPHAADFVVFSGHKMYAPFGAGALVGPRAFFRDGDPFLAGGGAVELVDLDEVVWSEPPEREEAGSPNVVGAVALGAAVRAITTIGLGQIERHDDELAAALRAGVADIPRVTLLGPPPGDATLPVATFVVEDMPHALVAARLSAEFAIGVRNGCFCAHPYLVRLLGLTRAELDRFRADARAHRRGGLPGAVRASAGIATTGADIETFLRALHTIVTRPSPVEYALDPDTGEYWPHTLARPAASGGTACVPGA